MKIWLDDVRPSPKGWMWALDYDLFVHFVIRYGIPDEVSLDHDLGHEYKDGYGAAKFLVEQCLSLNVPLPIWRVHSANPVGKENIEKLLINYNREHYAKNK